MKNLSIIPVRLIRGANGKVLKVPNGNLLKEATKKRSWLTFQKRLPTPKEREIFMRSSHQAIVTGEISGITVIDLDGTAEQDLLKQGYELPHTPTVRTQSGGKHLYFKYTDKLQTSAKINDCQNIDVRNNGGYVVAFGEGYEWIHHIHDTELQEVPEIFLDMVKGDSKLPSNQDIHIAEGEKDAYSKARAVDMVDFLRNHGYNVSEGENFSCIFSDHEDCNPSAHIVKNNSGDHRYICHSHDGGRLNLSLIDLWSQLKGLDEKEALEEVLSFIGIEYEESEFIKGQKKKYHYNTRKVSDLSYIKENYPYLYKYLYRYELELRALMDYAEANLHGTKYSYNGEAIFYISKRYAGKMFSDYKRAKTINTRRAENFLDICCTLGILERIATEKISKTARESTSRLTKEGSAINFYSFSKLTDQILSVADYRAELMQKNNFKVSTMTKDILISIFGQEIANKVFPDSRTKSKTYREFFRSYSVIIMREIESKGYTTKQEVISKLDLSISKRKKEYHFDKVINEILDTYQLEFNFQNKELRKRFNISGRGRKRLIYKA